MSPNYIQAACHCRPLRMCSFCARWLDPNYKPRPKPKPKPKAKP